MKIFRKFSVGTGNQIISIPTPPGAAGGAVSGPNNVVIDCISGMLQCTVATGEQLVRVRVISDGGTIFEQQFWTGQVTSNQRPCAFHIDFPMVSDHDTIQGTGPSANGTVITVQCDSQGDTPTTTAARLHVAYHYERGAR